MLFEKSTPLDAILKDLLQTYIERVPDVLKITQSMIDFGIISSQENIVNDHIAFRTMGVPNLGIQSFEKNIFETWLYQKGRLFF